MIAITAKQARTIYLQNGWAYADDGIKTYYAADENDLTNCFEFDNKKERDEFVNQCNN